VIGFFLRCAEQFLSRIKTPRHHCLTLIQRLSADFSGVIDTHEPCRVLALTATECGFNVSTGRGGACRALCGTAGFASELAESLIDATQ
jgi:hypothetical protein